MCAGKTLVGIDEKNGAMLNVVLEQQRCNNADCDLAQPLFFCQNMLLVARQRCEYSGIMVSTYAFGA
jgi:hypothetical protein